MTRTSCTSARSWLPGSQLMPKPTKFFYDTEFLEDGKVVDLISIGIVNYETGDEFYAVSTEFDTLAVADNKWLMTNVMRSIPHDVWLDAHPVLGIPVPNLTLTGGAEVMNRRQIRDGILEFTEGTWPDFWAWYGSYDHVALAQLWGRMIDLPRQMPMFTSDIKQLHKMAGNPRMPAQIAGLHNALEDARFNVVRYDYLVGQLAKKGISL
jgi:hypothetical protein